MVHRRAQKQNNSEKQNSEIKEDKKELKKLKNEVNHLKAKLKRAYYTKEMEKTEGDSKHLRKY